MPASNSQESIEQRLRAPFAALDDNESAQSLIARALAHFGGDVALVSSFGADAIALLHIAASINPDIPVIFVDTKRHFAETLAYVNEAANRLGLTNLRRATPRVEDVARLDPEGLRAEYDPDGCCDFRKTAPLAEALKPFAAWISGRKRFQAQTREALPLVERDGAHVKINPLANWSGADIEAYRAAHDLPPHPLVARGYPSIGCEPCTSPVAAGEDPRAGRWRGFSKTECGIHVQSLSDAQSLSQNRVSGQDENISAAAFPAAASSIKAVQD